MSEVQRPIELFYIYAQQDEKLRVKIDTSLSQLVQQQQIIAWYPQKLSAGTDHEQETKNHLQTAQIFLLLLSPDFMAMHSYYGVELQQTIKNLITRKARVIPILLRPTELEGTVFSGLVPLPSNLKPVTTWRKKDDALLDIAKGIRLVIEELKTFSATQPEKKSLEQQSVNSTPSIQRSERPATVFLSYAHEDTKAVRELQLGLNVRGLLCLPHADDGSSEHRITRIIEHKADVFVLFFTPASLKEDSIWHVEVPAALHRHKYDSHFSIISLLQDISSTELRQWCLDHNLTDLSRFSPTSSSNSGIDSVIQETQLTKWNDAAKRILRSALIQHLERIHADRSYEPWIGLSTFSENVPTAGFDLHLNWFELTRDKERQISSQEWKHIFLQALKDVKQSVNEKVPSHRTHIVVQCILPVAIALGFVFCKTTEITLVLEGKNGTWSSDTSASEKDPLDIEWLNTGQAEQGEAVIAVNAARNRFIRQSVVDALPMLDLTPSYHAYLSQPDSSSTNVKDAAHAQAIAEQVGQVGQNLCDRHRVRHIHLFVAAPAELAVLIGRQLNALCPITLYEYAQSTGTYTPVGTLMSKD